MKIRRIRTIKPKILRRLERILLRGFLCVLRVLAVNAGQHFHREDTKDAKETLTRPIWLRRGCSVLLSRKYFTFWKGFFGQDYLRIPRPDPRRSAQCAFISGLMCGATPRCCTRMRRIFAARVAMLVITGT